MTEAERIAQELVEEIDGFPQATKLEQEACNMIRSQAAEINRLRDELENCVDLLAVFEAHPKSCIGAAVINGNKVLDAARAALGEQT